MSVWTVLWIVWIAAFATLEGLALRDKRPGDTLSEFVWRVFRVRDRRPTVATWIGRGLLLIGGVWLTGHLAFGWWSF
ncbi:hypothetical protein [Actinomadura alba]|uniref:Integral membrane protein n=1 Tax=Actinomadura alba TaxID=406431 RepID=A0ABR7LMK6_9ACTN|nr:hypothetical protein [Actinomadura alba]MBC6465730.1 hypothetical protein [Actinomadura alba]